MARVWNYQSPQVPDVHVCQVVQLCVPTYIVRQSAMLKLLACMGYNTIEIVVVI